LYENQILIGLTLQAPLSQPCQDRPDSLSWLVFRLILKINKKFAKDMFIFTCFQFHILKFFLQCVGDFNCYFYVFENQWHFFSASTEHTKYKTGLDFLTHFPNEIRC
jgi:hypothetical protein